MKKGLGFAFIFLVSLSISVVYQNCGSSSVKANSSDNGDLQVEVIPPGGEPTTTTTPGGIPTGDGNFVFNINDGDNVFFVNGGGLSLDLSTSRYLIKSYYSMLETHVYEQSGVTFPRDLPNTGYCANSALPHCAHLNPFICNGYGCFDSQTPVRCHWQNRMSTANVSTTTQALNSLKFMNRIVSADDPMISDCDNPNLHFYKENASLDLSLAARECVPNGKYYASENSDAMIEAIFNNEINDVKQLMDAGGDPEFCNSYASYAWDTTKFSYKTSGGFTTALNASYYQVNYENQRVDMRWKEAGDSVIYCATGVPVGVGVDPLTELNVFFPSSGLQYEVFRTQTAIADAPTAEITYEDPVNGGAVWRLFLDKVSAMTNTGGAVMDSTQSAAIRDMIENILINRAKTSNMAAACPAP